MGNYRRTGYHGMNPEWRNTSNLRGKYIGVEFECIAANGIGGYHTLLQLLPDFKFGRNPITESDGSLSSTNGVEIVFPPVSYRQLKNPKSVFARSIASLHGKTSTRSRQPGMHLNINIMGWTSDKQQIFSAVFHKLPRARLEAMGGRSLNRYCSQYNRNSLTNYRGSMWHSVACNKGNRIELRFPKPTTDHKKIVQLVEAVEAIEMFANYASKKLALVIKYNRDLSKLISDLDKYLRSTKRGKKSYEFIFGKSVDSATTKAECVSVAAPTNAPASQDNAEEQVATSAFDRYQLGQFYPYDGQLHGIAA